MYSFLYFVSKPSITGVQNIIEQSTLDYIEKIKPIIKNQLFIGFGISAKSHIEQLKKTSIDGFIIGSKIISLKQNEIEVYFLNGTLEILKLQLEDWSAFIKW